MRKFKTSHDSVYTYLTYTFTKGSETLLHLALRICGSYIEIPPVFTVEYSTTLQEASWSLIQQQWQKDYMDELAEMQSGR